MWPVFAWDGGRRVAFAAPAAPAGAILTLIAHGPEVSACAAVWEAAAGVCIAPLPEQALHLDLLIAAPGHETVSVAAELDSQLAPAMADLTQPGLRHAIFDPASRGLSATDGGPATGLVSLNLGVVSAAGLRVKIGPLTDVASDASVTTAAVAPQGAGVHVALGCPGGASPVLAALIPVDRARLAAFADDATGASGAEAAARGFSLTAIEPAGLTFGPFGAGDRLLLLAPRNHRIAHAGGQRPGTRLLLTGDAGGVIAELTTHAYRPATSTALAALSGGGLTAANGGADAANAVDDAAALAEAYWKRMRDGGPVSSAYLTDAAAAPNQPMARLTQAAFGHLDAGISPLAAAMGAALSLPPALVEEIEALSATDRAAMAQWSAVAPETAADACRLRVILPALDGTIPDGVVAAAKAAADPDFAARLRELADRLAPKAASAERRGEIALLREIADSHRANWMPAESVAQALQLLARNPAPAAVASPAARLLADIKRNASAWAEAQRESRTAEHADIAERRSMIPLSAMGAGLPADTLDDLERKLPGLASAEIILLHWYVVSLAKQQALIRGVKLAILAMDEAAGSRGLASRMDRSGDPVVGMTRIGSASEPVVRELIRMPQARDALVALTTWINSCVPAPDAGHSLSEQLVRNLKSYGCFLLMNAVTAECRTHLAPATESAAAFATRLSSGLAETLPRFAAAATARAGDDIRLGQSFTDKLPSLHGTSAS
jgi:hypothetical protein